MRRPALIALMVCAGCWAPTEPCVLHATADSTGHATAVVRAGCTTEITATYDTTGRAK